ncbi:hypothetical protein EV193_112168 [Herbihabitans rhizosphaerae]|uniref:DUF8017 domain-containing protein n=1 Tax=Herbihabitans rhizosphaerae TaxID=1872711 RepID=A0A4Q7KE62_9PSEU|nr:hypothetical protein [Herbihabitans rhizosphaerae]RZS32534.1 hypothetical protein EV193_112168 [Herbihabitans rhizosphaerae]
MTYPGDEQDRFARQGDGSQNWQFSGQYQGLGAFDAQGTQPPEGKPPKRPNWTVILSVVALVVIVGAVTTIVLVSRKDTTAQPQQTTQGPQPTTSAGPPVTTTTSRAPTTTTTRSTNPLATIAPQVPGWQGILNEQIGLAYDVPPQWTQGSGTQASKALPNNPLNKMASLTPYQCDVAGKQGGFSRGVLGSVATPRSDIAKAAGDLAIALSQEFYDSATDTQVQAQPARPVTRTAKGGLQVTGVQVDAIVTTGSNPCLATRSKLSILALDYKDKYVMLMVNIDLQGGPATPPSAPEADLQKILDTARLVD